MDNGVFQLLFIALLILASVFDGVSRRRKRRRRAEEMEREEKAGGEDGLGSGPSFPGPARSLPGSDPARTGAPSRERETADAMVPDDLWAILTGEERPGAGRGPPETSTVSGEVVSVEPSPGSVEWGERFPEAPGGLEPIPPPVATPPSSAGHPPVWTPVPVAAGTTSASPARLPRRAPSPAPSRRPPGMTGARQALPAMHEDAARPRSVYVELLRDGGRGSLRQAIVFAEVFGTPAALRPPRWQGDGVS